MFENRILPRLSETDAMGHINNTVLPAWLEESRRALYDIFIPELSLEHWNLILRKYEVEFFNQIFHTGEVRVQTWVDALGASSIIVGQSVWQGDSHVASAQTVLIYFDYQSQKPATIPEAIRQQLSEHMQGPDMPC